MKRVVLALGVLGFLLAEILGCASLTDKNQAPSDKPLQTKAILKFSDLPVPMDFQLLPKDSYSFESSGIRIALLKYQSKSSIPQIVSFFKEQFPIYNWELLNTTEYGDCMMNFEREKESCIINISPKGRVSLISISLGPRPQPSSTKKNKPPLK